MIASRPLLLPTFLLAASLAVAQNAPAAGKISFNRDIRPILSDNCFYCHGPDAQKQKGNLRLDSREAALKGGKSESPALVPGKPETSEMIVRLLSEDPDEQMPPKKSGKHVTKEQIALLKRWISEGGQYEGLWSFTTPKRPAVPSTKAVLPGKNPIDQFIVQRLEEEGLGLSPEADKATQLRRASLDLTGVPPTPEELTAFLADKRPDSYEKALDRLFASPRYGETMAVQWLDFARYADSHGFQADSSRDMWLWRDWVINAYNQNKPFDKFTIEQLAGDLLPNPTDDQIIATGFNRNHRLNGEGGRIVEEWFVETVIDRVETTGQTWMGLTLGCARCHDHKYDPISQKDFYQLFAFFNSIDETGVLEGRATQPVLSLPSAEQKKKRADLKAEQATAKQALQKAEETALANLEAEVATGATATQPKSTETTPAGSAPQGPAKSDDTKATATAAAKIPEDIHKILALKTKERDPKQKKRLASYLREKDKALSQAQAKADSIDKAISELEASIPTTMVMREIAKPRDAFILTRGQYDKRAEKVGRALPEALPALPQGAPLNRLGLAQWLVSPDHPLTSRVWVNRAWEKFFGTGFVKTSENMGSQAEWPSHPELLDWLACEFVQPTVGIKVNGKAAQSWDMKALQKLILMSATYRQSSKVTPALLERDPDNRLLARGARFRLPGESIRDSALFVSGLLAEKVGGPSVRPYMPKGVWDETSVYGDLRNYKEDQGDSLYRRTLYTIWKRTAAPPTELIFDSPNREICTVKRSRTNTPLQALALLNEVTFVEAARKMAERMVTQPAANPEQRLQWAFQSVTSRMPEPAELKTLSEGLQRQLAYYKQNPAAAKALIAFGSSKSTNVDPVELAAYTVCANVLLNLDEFVTR